MSKRKISAFTIFIVFLFLTNSCTNNIKKTSTIEKNNNIKPIFERELELIEVLNHYNVPTINSKIILIPPTKCSSCKLGALRVLEKMKNIYILTGDSSFYIPVNKSQKIVIYDSELINKKGLVKLYSAIITINDNKVIKYVGLTN